MASTCRARAPALDPIGSRHSRTTELLQLFTVARGPVPRDRRLHQSSVGQERLLLTRSGAGTPELQRWTPRSMHGEGNPLACTCGMRGPKPYEKKRRYRLTVARGPVPRDRCLHQSSVGQERLLLTRSGAGAPELQRWTRDRCMARDRPSPYGKGPRYRMARENARAQRDQEVSPTAPSIHPNAS